MNKKLLISFAIFFMLASCAAALALPRAGTTEQVAHGIIVLEASASTGDVSADTAYSGACLRNDAGDATGDAGYERIREQRIPLQNALSE